MGDDSAPSVRHAWITRLAGGAEAIPAGQTPEPSEDWLAVEEPLEVRVAGRPFAVLLRSPGQERELIAGFLASERLLGEAEDLTAIEACRNEQGEAEANIWNVALAEGVRFDPEKRRWLPVGSTCGLCGARTIEELAQALPRPVAWPALELAADAFARSDQALRDAQRTHRHTAGAHGAGLFTLAGELLHFAEDVGRHNAVDKVLGACLLQGRYPVEEACFLQVTGRLSFEIVQKAALAGVPIVAGAGAPTALAVDAATRAEISLFGLVRKDRANRYVGAAQWQGASARLPESKAD